MPEKLCKDCDYYRSKWKPGLSPEERCVARSAVQRNRVTGKLEYLSKWHTDEPQYCRASQHEESCGPGAQFFKTKPSLWRRIRRALFDETPKVRW